MTNGTYVLFLLTIIAACGLHPCMKYLQVQNPVQPEALPEPARTFRVDGFAPAT